MGLSFNNAKYLMCSNNKVSLSTQANQVSQKQQALAQNVANGSVSKSKAAAQDNKLEQQMQQIEMQRAAVNKQMISSSKTNGANTFKSFG